MVSIVKILQLAEKADAIGACVAILLQECEESPHIVRAVFSQPVFKAGFQPRTVLDTLNKVCGKG
jgi:hypothetical protein